MTCIAGLLEDNGAVWLGADTFVTSEGHWCINRSDDKVFRKGYMLIGFTGSTRLGQLIQHGMELPDLSIDQPFDIALANALRKCLRDGGFTETENGKESYDGNLLCGMRGDLFAVDSYFGVTRPRSRYLSAGSGSQIAMGAFYATEGQTPEHRIRIALEAAREHDPYVREPFKILNL